MLHVNNFMVMLNILNYLNVYVTGHGRNAALLTLVSTYTHAIVTVMEWLYQFLTLQVATVRFDIREIVWNKSIVFGSWGTCCGQGDVNAGNAKIVNYNCLLLILIVNCNCFFVVVSITDARSSSMAIN